MEQVNWEDWERKELFDYFSKLSQPFYSVTFTVDVTDLYRFTKKNKLSFYYSLVYLCTKAINHVVAFRYMVDHGKLLLLDERVPSFRDLKPGSETFHVVTMPCGDDIELFCRAAREKSLAQTTFLDQAAESSDLIHFSCLPWVDVTGLTNDRDFDPDDAMPRIAWGKYTEENGRKKLHISLELNHRFTDGIHIGKFYEELCRLMAEL